MKYIKSIGLSILYLALTFAVFKAMSFIFYNSSFQNIVGFKKVIDKNPHIPMILWFLLSFLILYIITEQIKKKSIFEYCGFTKISIKVTLIMVYIGLGAFIFNTAFVNISFIDKNFPQFDSFLSYNYENSHILLAILSAVIIGPIFEEFLFRGLIFNELRNVMPVIPAALVSSVLYGVLFFDIPLLAFCFIAALLYSFIYVQTNTLVAIIVIQFTATFGVLVSRRLGIENVISNIGDIYMIPVFIISILIVVSGCYGLWREKHKQIISVSG